MGINSKNPLLNQAFQLGLLLTSCLQFFPKQGEEAEKLEFGILFQNYLPYPSPTTHLERASQPDLQVTQPS